MKRILNWLRALFRRPSRQEMLMTSAAEIVSPLIEQTSEPEPAQIAKAKKTRAKADPLAIRFEKDVLDQLKHYMKYIKRMRSHDRDAYDLYKQVGAQIVPYEMRASASELDPWFRDTLPAFGAVAHVGAYWDEFEKTDKSCMPRFVYFKKMARPPHNVQQINRGTLYMMTAFFTHPERDTFALPVEFPILVDGGEVRPLLLLTQQTQVIRHRRAGADDARSTTIARQRWGLSPHLVDWAAEHNKTPVEMAAYLFKMLACQYTQTANQTIRVEARDRNIAAVFVVDILRTPQFFADREKIKTTTGKTAPIFHIVRPHARVLKNGKRIGIKAHFSGLSQFKWNGYSISITVPGKDHVALSDATFGSYDEDTLSEAEKATRDFATVEQVGAILSASLKRKGRA